MHTARKDIILVRMTSDSIRPPEQRYNYSNAITGLVTLIREEGFKGLTRGLGVNMVRVAAISQTPFLTSRLYQLRAMLMNVCIIYSFATDIDADLIQGSQVGS